MSDFRKRLAKALDSLEDEQVQSLITDALGAEKVIWPVIVCPNCGHDHKPAVEVADLNTRIKAVQILADQGKGRPAEQKTIDVNLNATVGSLHELSDEELGRIVDSETKELEGPS